MIILELFLYLLLFGLIIIAAIQDFRTRNMALWTTIPFGLIAILLMVLHGHYIVAVLVFLALYLPKGGVRQLILYGVGVILLINLGLRDASPVIVALFLTDFLGRMEWYYDGDLVFLIPIYGLCNDWYIFAWMTVLILIVQFYLNYKRYKSLKGMILRTRDVFNKIRKGQQPDEEALRTPALVYISIGFLGYCLIFPGYFTQLLISTIGNL